MTALTVAAMAIVVVETDKRSSMVAPFRLDVRHCDGRRAPNEHQRYSGRPLTNEGFWQRARTTTAKEASLSSTSGRLSSRSERAWAGARGVSGCKRQADLQGAPG